MTAPDFLPVLSGGAHADPSKGACVMEYVSMLAGEQFSDHPSCTHPVLAAAARLVNDRLPYSERHLLVPLIGRLFGTGDASDAKLSANLARWCAADAANVPAAARAAAYAARDDAYAAARAAAYAADAVDFLARLIDEYDRLTGRTEHADFAEELPKVAELVGVNA